MTTAEAPLLEDATLTDATTETPVSMEDQEKRLGETAKAEYLAAGVKKKAARAAITEWDAYFAERGVNPQMQIDRMVAAANGTSAAAGSEQVAVVAVPPAAPKVAAANPDGPEGQFVTKFAGMHPKNGFTLDEIVKAAIAEKIITDDTPASRQPFYKIVLGFKNVGTLIEAEFQRETKTVYLEAAK